MTSQHQEEDQHDQQDCEEDGYGTPLAPIWKAGHRGDLPGLGTPSLRHRYPNISEAEEEQSRSCPCPGNPPMLFCLEATLQAHLQSCQ